MRIFATAAVCVALVASCGSPPSGQTAVSTTAAPATTTVQIRVPDVVGELTEFAAGLLSTLGLEAVVTAVEGLRGEPGVVVKQLPLPGTAVTKRSVVVLQTPPPIPATTAAPVTTTTAAPAATTAAPVTTTTTQPPATTTTTTTQPPATTTETCHASLAEGPVRCAGIDLQGWAPQLDNYDDGDFSGANLDGVYFGTRSFRGADFTNASLVDARVEGSSDWTGATLRNADLTGFGSTKVGNNYGVSIFVNVDFRGATFTGAIFSNNDLSGALMDGVDFSVASGANSLIKMPGASLVGADFSGFNWMDGLGRSDFSLANLTNANFSATKMHASDFNGADLTGADLTGTNINGSTLIGANLTNVDFTGASIGGADFTDAVLEGAVFENNTCLWYDRKPDWGGMNFPPACP